MNKLSWTTKPVTYENNDRPIALLMHDQGGWPFIVVGYLYGKFGPGFHEENEAWEVWMKGGRVGPKPHRSELIPHLRISSSGDGKVLSSFWNIDAWAELPTDIWLKDAVEVAFKPEIQLPEPVKVTFEVELIKPLKTISEALFERLAVEDPGLLLTYLESGDIPPHSLTYAAEIAGNKLPTDVVVGPLLRLLKHESAVVREGALRGLRLHYDPFLAVFRDIAATDESPMVRQVATEVLEDDHWTGRKQQ